MNDQPQGQVAGGRTESMDPTRLREILLQIGWTQRELSAVLDFKNDSTVRAMARGKSRIWPVMASWLETLAAYQAKSGFPIGILWWSDEYASVFAEAAVFLKSSPIGRWLSEALAFHRAHRWPADDWSYDALRLEGARLAVRNLESLGIRAYGDLGRALRLDMRDAKSWQRRPGSMPVEVIEWIDGMAAFKAKTGFPIEVFCLNEALADSFLCVGTATHCPEEAAGWVQSALDYYDANQVPVGFDLADEQLDDEQIKARRSALDDIL